MASSTSTSVEAQSQAFQTEFEDICREIQGSVLPNIIMTWTDDDGVATDSCVLGPFVDGGMPERLVAHLKNNLVDLSAFDGGDFQDWNVARSQPQWPTSTPDWEKWLPRMEHFFGQQWKDQGIYHLIKLFDRSLVMDRSLLAAALCFWSSATNTMNFRFGMMTPTVLDMAALFGLSPLGVEVNAALVAPEVEGSFKATWPNLTRVAGSKAKNMLNYSSFYNNFGVEDSAEDDAIAPLGEGGRLALGPFLLGHIYRTLHNIVIDGIKPKHGGPLWAFQFWLQAYFSELRGVANIIETEPLANAFARAPRKHNASAFCYKFFYGLVERTSTQFCVCLARPFPLFLADDLSIIPDGETENDLREIRGSFLVTRDLHCGLSKAEAERADVAQQHGVSGISFQLQKGMTFITLTPWLRRNAYDEDGRVWYEECISARFIRPIEEAARVALKNVDWDPLPPKGGKGKKASTVPPRSSTSAMAVPRVTAPPLAGATVAASTAAPTSRATAVVGARKTLAHRTVPSSPSVRPSAAAAPGRKRSREAPSTEVAQVGAAPAGSVVVETATLEWARKRTLLVLSEGEDEEEAPPVIVGEAPPVADEVVVEEEAAAAEMVVEEVAAAEVVIEEVGAAETVVEVVETLDVEAITAEVLATAEATADMSDDEVVAVEPTRTAPVEVLSAASAVPSLAVTASAGKRFVLCHT
ncbi:uncharacterized protein Pyn_08971 [Prunus yedoensis var. nudiflora]|uniref:Aminotransferase-like plant mobile domain-containing protein n=1 Tax=Prunus yedoensis var. nudiflora TaxID=2094558 RepID=A0A314YJ73_PRUYE|nr:uncharacterized protein Pyn_08971 [Prunus yedoensis var. nudiflora]